MPFIDIGSTSNEILKIDALAIFCIQCVTPPKSNAHFADKLSICPAMHLKSRKNLLLIAKSAAALWRFA